MTSMFSTSETSETSETLEGQSTPVGALLTCRADLDQARTERDQARRALDAFKDQVREVAIEVKREMGWCTAGLNDRLTELGLDTFHDTWDVQVQLTVSVQVAADDQDDAESEASDQVARALSYLSYDVDQVDADPAD